MAPLRKKGRGGGGGKTLAPHPDEIPGISPPVAGPQKNLPGLRVKKVVELKSPQDGSYGSSNLAATVLRSFQKDKVDRKLLDSSRASLNLRPAASQKPSKEKTLEVSILESTQELDPLSKQEDIAKVGLENNQKTVLKNGKEKEDQLNCRGHAAKEDRAKARAFGKELGEERFAPKPSRRSFGDDRVPEVRRSVSAQHIREARERDTIDSSNKPGVTMFLRDAPKAEDKRLSRGFLKSSSTIKHDVSLNDERLKRLESKFFDDNGRKPGNNVAPDIQRQVAEEKGRQSTILESCSLINQSGQPDAKSKRLSTGSGSDSGNISSSLQERLALLEGKVNQLAAELKETREIIQVANPSKDILSDIQMKLSSIENFMCTKLGESVSSLIINQGLVDGEHAFDRGLNNAKSNAKTAESEMNYQVIDNCLMPKCFMSNMTNENVPIMVEETESSFQDAAICNTGANNPLHHKTSFFTESKCLSSDPRVFEERVLPHRTLMKNRPNLHQKLEESKTALYQKIVENRTSLKNKIAALELEGQADGEIIAAEFLASLKQNKLKGTERIKAILDELMPQSVQSCGKNAGQKSSAKQAVGASESSIDRSSEHSLGKNSCERKRRNSEMVPYGTLKKELPTSKKGGTSLNRCMQDSDMPSADRQDVDDSFNREVLESEVFQKVELKDEMISGHMVISSSIRLECDENLLSDDGTDDQENSCPPGTLGTPYLEHSEIMSEKVTCHKLRPMGEKVAMAGWFVYEGEGILLAHEDGSCSFHDVANMEEKTQYKGPDGLSANVWQDCWLIRAAGTDGRSTKYVVAASAGSALDPAFCSWNFYDKSIAAYHSESQSWPATPTSLEGTLSSKDRLSPDGMSCGSLSSSNLSIKNESMSSGGSAKRTNAGDCPLWWYRPCGPLLASGGSGLKVISLYDIRDGDLVMKWETRAAVTQMDFSSSLQWRNKGKLVVAEEEAISLWDVNSLEPARLHNVNLAGRKIGALHIYNSDAECSGGVRQRISSSETGGADGVVCTDEAVNVLDFRVPAGVALKVPTFGETIQTVYARGDSIYAGLTPSHSSSSSGSLQCKVYQWSIRKAKPMVAYGLPSSNAYFAHQSLSQVWGSAETVMTINGNGLFLFDASAAKESSSFFQEPDVIGTDDLYYPSFDFCGSRVLLISRDRPASWCYWPR